MMQPESSEGAERGVIWPATAALSSHPPIKLPDWPRTWEDICSWIAGLEFRIEELERKLSDQGVTVVAQQDEGRE
jgi:hypothetical protein